MKTKLEVQSMFEIPENHTAVAIIGGNTVEERFLKCFEGTVEESTTKDMDANSSRAGLQSHPVLVAIIEGSDGHKHSIINLPLQKWQMGLNIDDEVEGSKDIKRITDWVAGFMHMFCLPDSVTAMDLGTEKLIFGENSRGLTVEEMVKKTRPQKETRKLESIGDVDEILGQLSKPQIEEVLKKPEKAPAEEVKTDSGKKSEPKEATEQTSFGDSIKEFNAKQVKEQREIVEKFGWSALEAMTKKMNLPILIKRK